MHTKHIQFLLAFGFLFSGISISGSLAQNQLKYIGSSTIGNFMKDASSQYQNADFVLDTEPESAGGEQAILEGRADLAGVANVPSSSTLSRGVVSTLIGWDAIATIVNEDVPVQNLTIAQLKNIFTGTTKNWNELGGPDLEIKPFIVGIQSATHKVFRSAILGEDNYKNCEEVSPDIDVLEKIKHTKGAIGHLSFSFLKEMDGIKIISVNGQKLTLTNSNYPITRPLYLLWWPGRRELADFADWVLSGEGQRIVMQRFIGAREGTITVSDAVGTLVVYTPTYPVEDGGTFFYPHRSYHILSMDRQVVMHVPNHLNSNDENPTKLRLSPGNYLVRPESASNGQKEFFVSIVAGKLTELDVREIEKPKNAEPQMPSKINAQEQGGLKIFGDLRIRAEQDLKKPDDRFRGRFRARLGMSTAISPTVKLEMRLITTNNPDDPNSPYSNFTNGFNQVTIALDRAIFQWNPARFRPLKLRLGKFSNPFQNSGVYSELSWDADIQTEGAAVALNFLNVDKISRLYFSNGTYLLSQFKTGNTNYWLSTNQLTAEIPVSKKQNLTFASGWYLYQNIKNSELSKAVFDGNAGNATFQKRHIDASDTTYTVHYASDFFVSDNFLLLNLSTLPRPLTLKGQLIYNFGAKKDNRGFAAGFSYGDLNDKGQWRVYYQYQEIQQDAVFSPFVQDDFSRQTNFKAHVFGFAFAFHKKISLHAWSLMDKALNASSGWQYRWRLDLNLKI